MEPNEIASGVEFEALGPEFIIDPDENRSYQGSSVDAVTGVEFTDKCQADACLHAAYTLG